MGDVWLDGVERIPGNSSGSFSAPVAKLLLHTTEGGSFDAAVATFRANNSWPHFTIDPRKRRAAQHVPLNVPSRSLRNQAGGVETNRDGVIQVEQVGFAGNPGLLSEADYVWYGQILGRICRAAGIPIQCSVTFQAWAGSNFRDFPTVRVGREPWRLRGQAWLDYRGWCGHQHADENEHVDPGLLPIALMLRAAGSTSPAPPSPVDTGELTMDAEAKAAFAAITNRLDDVETKVESVGAGVNLVAASVQALRDWLPGIARRIFAGIKSLGGTVPDRDPGPS